MLRRNLIDASIPLSKQACCRLSAVEGFQVFE